MPLTDKEIANIIFNETRSLSGGGIVTARTNIAHSIINAEAKTGRRPKTGPTDAKVPKQEGDVYDKCTNAVVAARLDRASSLDPTKGATNFNFRKNNWSGDFYGLPIKTQTGPLNNSYPTADLPAANIFANTYGK